MELTRVILGPVVTEKSERQKVAQKTYTLRVANQATKVDIRAALKRLYDVDVADVRIVRVGGKVRMFGRGRVMQKRHPFKKAIIKLSPKSKTLDLTAVK